MSRREDIDNAIWSDPDFEALSLDATALYLWSFTNPRCGMAGLYKVSRRAMTESKVPDERLDAALEELAAANFAYFQDGVLFVRSRVKHLRQRTTQIAKSIARDVVKVADGHPMRMLFLDEYGQARWLHEALTTELQATLDGDSPEGQGVGSLEPFSYPSGEGHSTLQGKGNGKGTGKGPLGRGVGRDWPTPPRLDNHLRPVGPSSAHELYRQWLEAHASVWMPTVPVERASSAIDSALRAGCSDAEAVRVWIETYRADLVPSPEEVPA